ncbi:hypothetical protein ACO2Q1_14900 [Brevundimonas sp. VNH65]|uniref:hypothetical protein n=1 Tax=Brevundimonas sp. VNH65 TaxID=3400917 RepID=UPI003C0085C9
MLSALIAAALIQTALPGTQNTATQATERVSVPNVRAGDNLRTAPAQEETGPDRVCRMEPVTGSRFPVRVCRGPRNSAANTAETREMLRQMQGLPELPNSLSGPKQPPAY